MTIYHKELAGGRWFTFSLVAQMANIGSEVHRTFDWFKKKEQKYFQDCFERALELFDLTLEDNRWKGRRKEIGRTRELFCSLLLEPEKYDMEKEFDLMNKYFDYFAIQANHERYKNRKT